MKDGEGMEEVLRRDAGKVASFEFHFRAQVICVKVGVCVLPCGAHNS